MAGASSSSSAAPSTFGQRVAAGRLYLAAVYRDARVLTLPAPEVHTALSRLYWVYLAGRPLFRIRCKSTFEKYRRSFARAGDLTGATRIALLQKPPNLIHRLSLYGFWLHSGWPSEAHTRCPTGPH